MTALLVLTRALAGMPLPAPTRSLPPGDARSFPSILEHLAKAESSGTELANVPTRDGPGKAAQAAPSSSGGKTSPSPTDQVGGTPKPNPQPDAHAPRPDLPEPPESTVQWEPSSRSALPGGTTPFAPQTAQAVESEQATPSTEKVPARAAKLPGGAAPSCNHSPHGTAAAKQKAASVRPGPANSAPGHVSADKPTGAGHARATGPAPSQAPEPLRLEAVLTAGGTMALSAPIALPVSRPGEDSPANSVGTAASETRPSMCASQMMGPMQVMDPLQTQFAPGAESVAAGITPGQAPAQSQAPVSPQNVKLAQANSVAAQAPSIPGPAGAPTVFPYMRSTDQWGEKWAWLSKYNLPDGPESSAKALAACSDEPPVAPGFRANHSIPTPANFQAPPLAAPEGPLASHAPRQAAPSDAGPGFPTDPPALPAASIQSLLAPTASSAALPSGQAASPQLPVESRDAAPAPQLRILTGESGREGTALANVLASLAQNFAVAQTAADEDGTPPSPPGATNAGDSNVIAPEALLVRRPASRAEASPAEPGAPSPQGHLISAPVAASAAPRDRAGTIRASGGSAQTVTHPAGEAAGHPLQPLVSQVPSTKEPAAARASANSRSVAHGATVAGASIVRPAANQKLGTDSKAANRNIVSWVPPNAKPEESQNFAPGPASASGGPSPGSAKSSPGQVSHAPISTGAGAPRASAASRPASATPVATPPVVAGRRAVEAAGVRPEAEISEGARESESPSPEAASAAASLWGDAVASVLADDIPSTPLTPLAFGAVVTPAAQESVPPPATPPRDPPGSAPPGPGSPVPPADSDVSPPAAATASLPGSSPSGHAGGPSSDGSGNLHGRQPEAQTVPPQTDPWAAQWTIAQQVETRSAGRSTEPAAAMQAASPAAMPMEKTQTTAQAAHGIKLDLGSGEGRVEVRVVDRGGEVRVNVHTPDERLAGDLRDHLPTLSARLEQTGLRAETWHSVASGGRPLTAEPTASAESRWSDDQHGHPSREQQHENPPRRPRGSADEPAEGEKGSSFAWLIDSLA